MSGGQQQDESQFAILKSPSFLPLFVTQAISAFNDNALRNGIAILITFDLAVRFGAQGRAYVETWYRWPRVMATLEPFLRTVADT